MINLKLQKPGYLNLFYSIPGTDIFVIHEKFPFNVSGVNVPINNPPFKLPVFLKSHPNFQLSKIIKCRKIHIKETCANSNPMQKITIAIEERKFLNTNNRYQTFILAPT